MDIEKIMLQLFAEGEGGETVASAEGENACSPENENQEKEFEELIKGKYSAAFSKKTQGIIDRRFARMKGYEKTAKAVEPLMKKLGETYPELDSSDEEGLINAFLQSEDKNNSDEIMKTAEAAAAEASEKRFAQEIERQEQELKQMYPSFSFRDEFTSSPGFASLIRAGVPMKRAYESMNFEKIMGTAMRYAAINAGKKTADAIKSGNRVQETAVADSASNLMHTDVNSLTKNDIMRIISEVGKGAKITF